LNAQSIWLHHASGACRFRDPTVRFQQHHLALNRRAASHCRISASQFLSTTEAELSPGIIEGITKRVPSADTSNETIE